jgi:hypothetical protein
MNDFIIGSANTDGLYCIFEDDGDTGYLYLSDHGGEGIIDHMHIYSHPKRLGVQETDVEVVWTTDGLKCGVKIWGNFYGVFDLVSSTKKSVLVKDRKTPPITDQALLDGFQQESRN